MFTISVRVKVAETLLKHGAEIDTDDVYDDGNPGLLPIDYAIQNNSKDIVELFLDHGYKIYNLNIWEKEIDEDSDEKTLTSYNNHLAAVLHKLICGTAGAGT